MRKQELALLFQNQNSSKPKNDPDEIVMESEHVGPSAVEEVSVTVSCSVSVEEVSSEVPPKLHTPKKTVLKNLNPELLNCLNSMFSPKEQSHNTIQVQINNHGNGSKVASTTSAEVSEFHKPKELFHKPIQSKHLQVSSIMHIQFESNPALNHIYLFFYLSCLRNYWAKRRNQCQ